MDYSQTLANHLFFLNLSGENECRPILINKNWHNKIFKDLQAFLTNVKLSEITNPKSIELSPVCSAK